MGFDKEQVLVEVARIEDALADIRYYADHMDGESIESDESWESLITSRSQEIERLADALAYSAR